MLLLDYLIYSYTEPKQCVSQRGLWPIVLLSGISADLLACCHVDIYQLLPSYCVDHLSIQFTGFNTATSQKTCREIWTTDQPHLIKTLRGMIPQFIFINGMKNWWMVARDRDTWWRILNGAVALVMIWLVNTREFRVGRKEDSDEFLTHKFARGSANKKWLTFHMCHINSTCFILGKFLILLDTYSSSRGKNINFFKSVQFNNQWKLSFHRRLAYMYVSLS